MSILVNLWRVAALAAVGVLFLTPARAVTIDFEGVLPYEITTQCPATPYTEDGFTLTATPSGTCSNYVGAAGTNPNGNATQFLVVCAGCSTPATRLTLDHAAAFSITSVDIGGMGPNQDPGVVQFIGFFVGGGSITHSIDPVAAFTTYVLSGFSNLETLDIQASNDVQHFALDNLQLNNAIPAPTALALLALGFAGFGLRRRRSRA